MRATGQKLLKAYTAMYSGDLLFLNSVIEDGNLQFYQQGYKKVY